MSSVGCSAAWLAEGGSGIVVVQRGCVGALWVPVRSTSLLCRMSHVVLVSLAVQPLSRRVPVDINEVLPRDGKMCACFAFLGRGSIGSSQVCVEHMCSLLVGVTSNGFGLGLLLVTGALGET
jgi:hypothetical protein